jgi:seryl-tRNA synthetase
LASIIENNQKEDGSVVIPKILRKWMANQEVIEAK